jgi:Putative lumazine-binding
VNRKNVINNDLDVITALVQDYFEGLHHADINKLQRIFHPDAYLKAPGLRRSVAQWLNLVSQREVPAQQGAAFDYRLLSVDIVSEQAMVKLVCPLLGRTYIDFLGLLKENGQWLIVNKMYADL